MDAPPTQDHATSPSKKADLRVALLTSDKAYLENRIFGDPSAMGRIHQANSHWLEPFQAWKAEADRQGICLGTVDRVSLHEADAIVLLDTFIPKAQVLELRKSFPRARIIRLAFESPLFQPWILNAKNHEPFDAVISYHAQASHPCGIPIGGTPIESPRVFESRKLLVLINAHQTFGLRKRLSTLKRTWNEGWSLTPKDLIAYFRLRELYSERGRLVRTAERLYGENCEVWGRDWPPSLRSYRGILTENKLSVLQNYRFVIAYENCANNVGYITEKIWDPLLAGSIPIYWGDTSVRKLLPEGAVIFREDFSSNEDLLHFLHAMPENEWNRRVLMGQTYLRSSLFIQHRGTFLASLKKLNLA